MIKAIIFDMDGVLADTDMARFRLLKVILAKRGIVLTDEDTKKGTGKRTKVFLKELFGDQLNDEEIQEIYDQRISEYRANHDQYIIPQPGAVACVRSLCKEFPMAIASASDLRDIKMVLKKLDLTDCFKEIVGDEMVSQRKPHPETYLKAAEAIGFDPSECVAIEDSPTGVASAKAAGLTCVAVTYVHPKEDLQEADLIVDSLEEVTPEYIKQIQND